MKNSEIKRQCAHVDYGVCINCQGRRLSKFTTSLIDNISKVSIGRNVESESIRMLVDRMGKRSQ